MRPARICRTRSCPTRTRCAKILFPAWILFLSPSGFRRSPAHGESCCSSRWSQAWAQQAGGPTPTTSELQEAKSPGPPLRARLPLPLRKQRRSQRPAMQFRRSMRARCSRQFHQRQFRRTSPIRPTPVPALRQELWTQPQSPPRNLRVRRNQLRQNPLVRIKRFRGSRSAIRVPSSTTTK